MPALELFYPGDVIHGRRAARDFPQCPRRFLAQGDSWFSLGSLNPLTAGSLLNGMAFDSPTCAVNCAQPGDVLGHMVDQRRDPRFASLLMGANRWTWDAILLSGGGNDLIDFIRTPSRDRRGDAVAPALRALLTQAERGRPRSAKGFVSEDGWAMFVAHIVPQYQEFVALRDCATSDSKGVPIFVHTYDMITPRDAGAGFGIGPWLRPALEAYEVPAKHWPALTRLFLTRFGALLQTLALPGFHVVQTQGTLEPAEADATGPTTDWENEIHPNRDGYAKLGRVFASAIEAVLSRR